MTFTTAPSALSFAAPAPFDPALYEFLSTTAAAGRRSSRDLGPTAARTQMEARAAAAPPGRDMATVHDVHLPRAGEGSPSEQPGGPAAQLRLRVYDPGTPRATVVYVHGGGWVIGSVDSFDRVCRELAHVARVRVVAVDYRLAPEHPFPAALDDVAAALTWTAREHGDLPLLVAGDSAGGNLAAVVAASGTDGPPLAGQVLIYPVTDADPGRGSYAELPDDGPYLLTAAELAWYWDQYEPDTARRSDPRIAPLRAGRFAGLPPAVVVVAGHDPLRDEARAYARALAGDGVPVDLHEYPTMGHGFISFIGVVPEATEVYDRIGRSLDELLAGGAPRA